ncbi:MAG TPA: carbohydrate ABC transporter permease [bacterium]|nr:carbohydrate ABC transporter permease [bacterium]HQO33484.1 carbohydrate ABC transporter permease [bacterium]HQP96849.1 carbohydrate ABC transporter permease [bacterium]
MREGRTLEQVISPVVLWTLLLLTLIPFVYMLSFSVKDLGQFEHERWTVSFPFHWENFPAAFQAIQGYVFNSILVSAGAVLGVLALSALGGFAFARGKFPFKETLFYLVIGGMMIPGILYLVPKFILFREFGLMNTRWALWLPYWTEGQLFGIFLVRSSIEALPSDLFHAAEIDGASVWLRFRHVALPLIKPILATLAVLNVLFTWNDIIWPWLVLTDRSMMTIPIGLVCYRRSFLDLAGPIFSAYVIASVPLLLLFAATSRTFVRGLTSGAFKA